ncbi:hypothetical protein QBC47DRAFT_390396 [Echria macrotheca]|uniref:Serine/threonine-protein kinase Tel1 n=1 Tax=Echria macrotheca TaxID=438768 RepID=A0AAJ0B4T2_9PEZI|nr:hypothetical protein QBC47DRAFT_390396 [Echria macrotheca]
MGAACRCFFHIITLSPQLSHDVVNLHSHCGTCKRRPNTVRPETPSREPSTMPPRSGYSAEPRSLKDLTAQLASSSSLARKKAVDDLLTFFQSHQAQKQDVFDDKGYHQIYESIFRCTLLEKESYFSTKKTAASKTRLERCAQLLRVVVRHGASKIRRKTVRAIIDHITQILPHEDGTYVAPLLNDYIKALRTLVEVPSNVENMSAASRGHGWRACVDFCIDAILRWLKGDDPETDSHKYGSDASALPPTSQIKTQLALDFVVCLESLVSSPNAPIGDRAQEIADLAFAVIDLISLKITEVRKVAFSTITNILLRVQAENTKLAANITRNLIPRLSTWWQLGISRDALLNSMRDEMLKALYASQTQLQSLLTKDGGEPGIKERVESLLDSLWSEYSKREDRDRLQLDDVSFTAMNLPNDHPRTAAFSLRPFNLAGEQNWFLLENLAILENTYSSASPNKDETSNSDGTSRKRQRTEMDHRRLHLKKMTGDQGVRLTFLQLLPFVVKLRALSMDEAQELLDDIASCCSDNPGNTVESWGMLAAASVAAHKTSWDSSLRDYWGNTWQKTVRSVSSPSLTRAACVLLDSILKADLVEKHEISEDLALMVVKADISGPAIVVDSSLVLMTSLLRLRNILLPNANVSTANHIARWVSVKWNPADLSYASTHGMHTTPFDLLSLFRACYGMPHIHMPTPLRSFGGPLLQFRKRQNRLDVAVRYLLLLGPEPEPIFYKPCISYADAADPDDQEIESSDAHSVQRTVLEYFSPIVQDLLRLSKSWMKRTGENSTPLSTDRLQSVVITCLSGFLMLPDLGTSRSEDKEELQLALTQVFDATLEAALNSHQSEQFFNLILRLISGCLPSLATAHLRVLVEEREPLLDCIAKLSRSLKDKEGYESISRNADSMDLDDDFDTASSQSGFDSKGKTLPRRDVLLGDTPEAFYLETTLRIRLIDIIRTDKGAIDHVPEQFVEYLVQLPMDQFLLCRSLMTELFTCLQITPYESQQEIIKRAGMIIGETEFTCCEASLSTCIDLLGCFVREWVSERDDGNGRDILSIHAGELYEYLVKTALPSNSLSAAAQVSLSELLFKVNETRGDYATALGLPSSLSTILQILHDGPMEVKFSIGLNLPNLFGLYILKKHEDIFVENVLEKLPAAKEITEGIACRLFILAELACRWPTLLRRCVYHIFETPGRVPDSFNHAKSCWERVSAARQLDSPISLFSLFAPQLLFTWLESNAITELPFGAFGFSSLEDLLRASSAEASAIIWMRGQEDDANELAQALGLTLAEMVDQNFPKIMAYSIAQDFSAPPSSPNSATGEARLRALLGKERFLENVHLHFADIIATFFETFDQENPIEKAFARDPAFEPAARIMAEIKECGHLATYLPCNQQPLFKAKYLQRQIVHLCSRTAYEPHTLWTPALIVFVARRLLNTIKPALGSLHACSVLRKIRVLLCFAGDRALASYPLEMLLYTTREFILDPECADDAIGILKYLLLKGESHLSKVPTFLAGFALASFSGLRAFLRSSQSSTTQESQFKETKDNANRFHGWLRKRLQGYTSPVFRDSKQSQAFEAITRLAAELVESGSYSDLILEVLRDWGRDNQLLDDKARGAAFSMICTDFKMPVFADDDIIDNDPLAVEHASAVWKSCRYPGLNEEYLSWAGRVLGRSYLGSGKIPEELLRESRLPDYSELSPGNGGSEEALLNLIQDLAVDQDRLTAGLAEAALRAVVTDATIDEDSDLLYAISKSLTKSLEHSSNWEPFHTPGSESTKIPAPVAVSCFGEKQLESPSWPRALTTYLALSLPKVNILRVLPPILHHVEGFAEKAFPFVIHLVLYHQPRGSPGAKAEISGALKEWLDSTSPASKENHKLLLNTILYLRTQRMPSETSTADRNHWLEVNFPSAAATATRCGMYKAALLFAELASSEDSRKTRRSSLGRDAQCSSEVLLSIFENIDDPDAYYGLEQDASLSSVRARLEYEHDGSKSLAFRGAEYHTHLKYDTPRSEEDAQAIINSLSTLGLTGISNSLLQAQQGSGVSSVSPDITFTVARRLEKWNLPTPATTDSWAVTLYKAYQSLHRGHRKFGIFNGLADTIQTVVSHNHNIPAVRRHFGVLAALTELDNLFDPNDKTELKRMLDTLKRRTEWMMSGRYDAVSEILSCRETSLNIWSMRGWGFRTSDFQPLDVRANQVRALLRLSTVYRFHHARQESLNISTRLFHLLGKDEYNKPAQELGAEFEAMVMIEAANSLWDQGEMIPSIRMLQEIEKSLSKQLAPSTRSNILSKIAHQVSVARLEGPDNIKKRYLEPALKELKGAKEGENSGRVFHQFAMFCDEQLQNPDSLEDLARLKHLKDGKSSEVEQLKSLIASSRDSQHRSKYTSALSKAKQWLDLDNHELQRVERTRADLVRLSLENYLLSLSASDEHNNDALRFTALWLERSGEDMTNETVKKLIGKVPTRKFAPLMNQLSSRLQDHDDMFQQLLSNLVYRICLDHPYHGMYQIWSGAKSRVNKDDEVAVSRQDATSKVAKALAKAEQVSKIWSAIDVTSRAYHSLAVDRDPNRYKAGHKLALKDCPPAVSLVNMVVKRQIPPPTLQIDLSDTLDYSHVPMIHKFEPDMSIASGVSAPKIITAVGTDGKRYKQLVKGGNDDLRQDAIMEQVFAAVSELLKLHRMTRQRNLGIRTYKVLPLTSSSGLIEFVPDTIPLHEYLMPAHERYFPKDLKGSQCRKEIANAQTKSADTRVSVYRKVTDKFHPVMRYFFMENFPDPDEWFARRTAYTRTTAAISMLGHVLGLGDRHGHNILLDSKTGEVVHIDLGVAFEMGRVLPVPELVPFRLTRDIVDGMGITKTEGVFRRCCEFTLDALREETYSIMTILDVLRYDPLYSWSISPVRMAKLQNARDDEVGGNGGGDDQMDLDNKKSVNEPSEADRALEVVRKKLSKTLSAMATVNDLINQATDERNLAVLYSGWAAYA